MKNALRFLLALAALGLSPASADLDGATGNIFKFDTQAKTFELLKETEYDPKTEEARSRFTVHWTDETKVEKITPKANFSGLGTQLQVVFDKIDKKNAAAYREGKPFMAGEATIFTGRDFPPEWKDDILRVHCIFTPDPGDAPTSGTFESKGKRVKVSVRPKVGTITHYEMVSTNDLAKGFWQTEIRGEQEDGRFVVRRM